MTDLGKRFDKMIESKKYAKKQFKKSSDRYSISNGKLKLANEDDSDKEYLVIMPDNCDIIQQKGKNNFTIHEQPNQQMTANGIVSIDYHFYPCASKYEYKW